MMRDPWHLGAAATLLGVMFSGCIDPPGAFDDNAVSPMTWQSVSLPKIDAKTFLENHNEFVTTYSYRQNDSPMHHQAREALAAEYDEPGLILMHQPFQKDISQENICGIKLGEVEPKTWIVVGGHFDTATWDARGTRGQGGARLSQGAYDDGSGTWLAVEIAKAFANVPTYYSIAFCAFDGEEKGLWGSQYLFQSMTTEDGNFPYPVERTRAMLNFDMFGINWPTRAPIHFDANDEVLGQHVDAVRKEMKIPDDMFLLEPIALGGSDHHWWYTYQEQHIPTGFFISDLEEVAVPVPGGPPSPVPPVPGIYPFIHWMDTVDTMTMMAGGPEMSRAGFQTALDLGVATVAIMASPDVTFEEA